MEDFLTAQESQPKADGALVLFESAAFSVSDILLTASQAYSIKLSLLYQVILPTIQIKILRLREIK